MLDKLVKTLLAASLISGCAQGVTDHYEGKKLANCPETIKCSGQRYFFGALEDGRGYQFELGGVPSFIYTFNLDDEGVSVSFAKKGEIENFSFRAYQGEVIDVQGAATIYFGKIDPAKNSIIVNVVDSSVKTDYSGLLVSEDGTYHENFSAGCEEGEDFRRYELELFSRSALMPDGSYGPGVAVNDRIHRHSSKNFTALGLFETKTGIDAYIIHEFISYDSPDTKFAWAEVFLFEDAACKDHNAKLN